jgi:PEP-CTERM motif
MGKRQILEAIVLSCVLGVGTVSTQAASLSLFDTGVSTSGLTLPNGATDPNYVTYSYPGGPSPPVPVPAFAAVTGIPPTYIPADPVNVSGSQWISGPLPNQGSQAVGDFDYRTLFMVPSNYDPSTWSAQIKGNIAADNSVTIFLNGTEVQDITNPTSYTSYTSFTISTSKDFLAGVQNYLDFIVHNSPPLPSPQGLRIDGISGFVSAPGVGAAVPEPASLISCLMGIGLVAAGMMAKRRWLAVKA